MSNVKISALPAATTPLTGTELVPLVQSGVTSQVAVSNIKTAPAGSNTQVQFNNSSAFGASASLTWDGTSLTATKLAGAHNGTVGATTPSTGDFTSVTGTVSSGAVSTYTASGANQSIYSRYIGGSPNVANVYVGTDSAAGGISGIGGGGLLWNVGNGGLAFGANNALAMSLSTTGALALKGASTSATGVGITFPATQSASTDANTLDDYEEGTWTPTVTAVTTTGSPAYAGSYVKIGKQVTATMYSTGNNSPTATYTVAAGSSRFTLPFSTANLNNNFQPWTGTSGNGSTTAGGLVAADGATCYFITAITVTQNICATITYSI